MFWKGPILKVLVPIAQKRKKSNTKHSEHSNTAAGVLNLAQHAAVRHCDLDELAWCTNQ